MQVAHDAALDERPKAFDRLSMNRADDVLSACMVNSVKRIFLGELAVSACLPGRVEGRLAARAVRVVRS